MLSPSGFLNGKRKAETICKHVHDRFKCIISTRFCNPSQPILIHFACFYLSRFLYIFSHCVLLPCLPPSLIHLTSMLWMFKYPPERLQFIPTDALALNRLHWSHTCRNCDCLVPDCWHPLFWL